MGFELLDLFMLAQHVEGITIDKTIHLSDIVMFGGGILAFLKVYYNMQKSIDKHEDRITTNEGEIERIDGRQAQHHDWLIRSGLDRRTGHERRSGE